MQAFALLCAVWSPEFVARLDRFCLSSLLAPDNLPAWPYRATTTLYIYCKPDDIPLIEALESYRLVHELIPIKIMEINIEILDPSADPGVVNKYGLMTLCHTHGVEAAYEKGEAVIFLFPDLIYSSQTMMQLANLIDQNKSLIFMLSYRVIEEVLVPGEANWPTPLVLDEQACFDLSLRYIHPENQAYFWFSPLFNAGHSSTAYVWQDAHTIEGYSYEYMPFYIQHPVPFERTRENPNDTLDGQYVLQYEHLLNNHQSNQLAISNQHGFQSLSVTPAAHLTTEWGAEASFAQRPHLMYQFIRYRYQSKLKHWLFQQKMVIRLSENAVATGRLPQPMLLLYQQSQPQSPWLAAEYMWQLEDQWLHGHYAQCLALFEQNQKIFDALQDPHLHFVYYYVASSLVYLGQWDALKSLVATYRQQLLSPALYLVALPPFYEGYQQPGVLPTIFPSLHQLSATLPPGPHGVILFDEKNWPEDAWAALSPEQVWLFIGSREDWVTSGLADTVAQHLPPEQWVFIDALTVTQTYGLNTKEFLHWSLDTAVTLAVLSPLHPLFVDLTLYALLRDKALTLLPISC